MAFDPRQVIELYNFSEDEKQFMQGAGTANTAAMNQSRVVSQFVLSKKIERATDKVIESNSELAKSNEQHSKAMRWLTAALVFVGVVQIIVQIIQIWK